MKPYIVKFFHLDEDIEGTVHREDMYLCLHAETNRDAMEKYVQVTGGEHNQDYLISVTGESKVEQFWNRDDWKFYTIPTD